MTNPIDDLIQGDWQTSGGMALAKDLGLMQDDGLSPEGQLLWPFSPKIFKLHSSTGRIKVTAWINPIPLIEFRSKYTLEAKTWEGLAWALLFYKAPFRVRFLKFGLHTEPLSQDSPWFGVSPQSIQIPILLRALQIFNFLNHSCVEEWLEAENVLVDDRHTLGRLWIWD